MAARKRSAGAGACWFEFIFILRDYLQVILYDKEVCVVIVSYSCYRDVVIIVFAS